MKKIYFLLVLVVLANALRAASVSGSSQINRTVTVSAPDWDIAFSVMWTTDDYPLNSAPGRIELLRGATVIGRVVASVYQSSGPSVSVTGGGTVDSSSSWANRFAPSGAPAEAYFSGVWHVTGLTPGTYTVRTWSYTTYDTLYHASTVWTETSYDGSAPAGPANRVPVIAWTASQSNAGDAQGYYISVHGHDDDGNLNQITVWKDGVPFANAGGGNGTDSEASNWTSDAGPRTVTFTAQATDATGATSAVIAWSVTIDAPPSPPQFILTTTAAPGGSVSSGGIFTAGDVATVTAIPDAYHDFAGWSGDAGGTGSSIGVLMDREKAVQANFAWKQFALATSATSGGSVTPGGSYPYGSVVTLTATADSTARFAGWSGGASGTATPTAVTITGPLTVQAVFVPKAAQTITFANPGDRTVGASPFSLDATSSAGLLVNFVVLSGPASLSGGQLRITGPGAITVQANQAGDDFYLPAPAVTQTFNSTAPVALKYRGAARTILQSRLAESPANLVLENP